MQAIADGRRQKRVRPPDFGDTLGVLDDADGLAPRVAADIRPVAGDLGRLLGEQPLGSQLLGRLEPAPAAIGEQDEENHRRRPDDRGSLEQRRQCGERGGRGRSGGGSTAGSPRRNRSRASSISSSSSSSVFPVAGSHTSRPSIRTSTGSSHSSPPKSDRSTS